MRPGTLGAAFACVAAILLGCAKPAGSGGTSSSLVLQNPTIGVNGGSYSGTDPSPRVKSYRAEIEYGLDLITQGVDVSQLCTDNENFPHEDPGVGHFLQDLSTSSLKKNHVISLLSSYAGTLLDKSQSLQLLYTHNTLQIGVRIVLALTIMKDPFNTVIFDNDHAATAAFAQSYGHEMGHAIAINSDQVSGYSTVINPHHFLDSEVVGDCGTGFDCFNYLGACVAQFGHMHRFDIAPPTVTGTAKSSTEVDLSWVVNHSDVMQFSLARATSETGPFNEVASLMPTQTTYQDTGLSPSTKYYYKLTTTYTTSDTYDSDVVMVATPAAPPKPTPTPVPMIQPTNLSGRSSGPNSVLTWSPSSANVPQTIYRWDKPNGAKAFRGPYPIGATPGQSSYVDYHLGHLSHHVYLIVGSHGVTTNSVVIAIP